MDKLKLSGVFENGYGLIPKKVMKDTRLHIYSKAIYAYLCSYSGSGESAFPSQKLIMSDLGISKDSLNKYLKQLKDYDYIKVVQEKENGKFARNVYTINVSPYTVSSDTVRTESVSIGYGQTDTNNNSYLNNNNIYNNNNKKIDRYPEGIGENNHRVEKKVTSSEVINQSLDTDKVKFRENLKKYMNMVSTVTGKNIMEISNVINPQSMKDYDLNLLIEEIENSDFLSGKLNKKPMITNFTRKTMIDRILIGEYRNKVEGKEEKIIKIYENKEINNVSIEI